MSFQSFYAFHKTVAALGKGVDHLIRSSSRKLSDGDAEQSIAEFERLSGSGHSGGSRFDRDETHQRR